MKKYLLLVLIAGIAFKSVKAQLQIDTPALINAYYNSEYIFEGMVVSQCSFADNNGIIYTTNTIQISKIFKGDLQCGTANIITLGGTFNGLTLDVSHNAQFTAGMTGVFACNILDTLPYENPTCPTNVTNDTPLVNYDSYVGSFEYLFDEINAQVMGFNSMFPTIQSFYDFLSSIGINVVECGGQIIQNAQAKKQKPYIPYKNTASAKSYQKNLSKANNILSKSVFASNNVKEDSIRMKQIFYKTSREIDFAISGATYNTEHTVITFDVNVKSNVSPCYLDVCEFRIQFNSGAFNSSAIASSITTSLGPDFDDAGIYSVTPSNVTGSSEFKIDITCDPAATNRVELSSNFNTLLTISITIQNCKYYPDLTLINWTYAYDNCKYTTTPDDDPINDILFSSYAIQGSPATGSVCAPLIYQDYSQPHFGGGKGEILTLTGENFGNTKGIIYVPDVSTSAYIPVWDQNVFSWTDTEIKLYVPSNIDTFSNGNPSKRGVAGSGNVYVVDEWGYLSVNSQPIYIDYSLSNDYPRDASYYQNNKYLFSANLDGKYHFKLNSGITNAGMINCIKAAFYRWTCNTGVGFVLDAGTTTNTYQNDGFNVISMVSSPFVGSNVNALALTGLWTQTSGCSYNSTIPFPIPEIDIAINPNYFTKFIFDTSGVSDIPTNDFDFLHVIIHEIGHAQCLQDVNNSYDVMHYNSAPGFYYASSRIDNPTTMSIVGADYIISKSINQNYGISCSNNLPLTRFVHSCHNDAIENYIKNTTNINIYPNPFSAKFEIVFESDIVQKTEITIYNSIGQEMGNFYRIINSGKNSITVDASSYSNGLYIVYLKTENNSLLTKTLCIK